MSTHQYLLLVGCFLSLAFIGYSARVKHSEYVKTWRVPNDDEADWPSPDQIYFDLGESLDGDVFLPGGWDYRNGSIMKNWRFQAKFGAVVYPESTSDVQRAVLFANEYGIRPTVYSTGHDFLGRSARDHTLSINMGRMKQMEVNLNDTRSPTNMTMSIGTGVDWIEAYEEADRYGVIVLGGSSPTVSPGGYILGGGHSPITRTHGLGVDQVVAFTIVTANGSIVYMTENGGVMQNPDGSTEEVTDLDFWWAVLGGGGGVYGIVTQYVLKLHNAPDGFVNYSVQWRISAGEINDQCEGVAEQALELFLDILRTNLTSNWGGYVIPNKNTGDQTYILGWLPFSLIHWGRDEQEAMSVLEEFSNFRTDCQDFSTVQVFDTFWDYQQQVDDTVWLRQHLIGTILQEEDCVAGSGAAAMIIDIVNATEIEDYYAGCTGTLIGGNAGDLPQDATAVSPDFRNGLVSLVCGSAWVTPADDEDIISGLVQYGNNRMYQYGTGAYYNENDYYLQNWQVEYWGSIERYQRLLAVKQRWDPDNMFWCHHCVGSEFA